MPSTRYEGPERRKEVPVPNDPLNTDRERRARRFGNNGAFAFGRRTIDRISRPRTILPWWVVLLVICMLWYIATVLT